MQRTITFFLVLVFLNSVTFAQFRESWFHTYDLNINDALYDVYAPVNGGYVACGRSAPAGANARDDRYDMTVLRVDDNGNIIWYNAYEGDDLYQEGNSLVEADNGDLVIAGTRKINDNEYGCTAWRIDTEGELIWSNTFQGNWAYAIIELKNGNFLICGNAIGPAFVTCIDGDGRQLWYQEYNFQRHNIFNSMRETEGGVLVAGHARPTIYSTDAVAMCVKIDPENDGELIWGAQYEFIASQEAKSIISAPNNGFIIAGVSHTQEGEVDDWIYASFFIRISSNGELEWTRLYEEPVLTRNCGCLQRLPLHDDDIIAVSSKYAGKFMYLNSNGEMQWDAIYDDVNGFDVEQMYSVVPGRDGSFVGCGWGISPGESYRDGYLIKFSPQVFEPQFIRWSPEDTVLTVLQNDSLQFSCFAQDDQGDSLIYRWLFEGDTVSRDTCFIKIFEDLGEEEIQCQVSDREHIVPIRWHITVDNFFIASTTPDSLRLLTRRGSTLPFTLDIACVEPDAPTVEWTVVNRDNDSEYIGEADTVEVCFDLAGEWAVEAEASWNGERESVRWAVDVRSAVWWWMPHEDVISVNRNEQRDFSVFAFDPDSDSLSIGWWLDGDSLDSNAEVLTLDFPDIGEYALVSIVRDGVETDTIRWRVTVNSSGLENDLNGLPFELALHPPAPNPFNSTTTIGYSLPVSGNVLLDLSGREVARLVDGMKVAGNHQVTWNANGIASGVYVVALDDGGMMLREKVVLVK